MITSKQLQMKLSRHKDTIHDCVSMSIRGEDLKNISMKALKSLTETLDIVREFISQEELFQHEQSKK